MPLCTNCSQRPFAIGTTFLFPLLSVEFQITGAAALVVPGTSTGTNVVASFTPQFGIWCECLYVFCSLVVLQWQISPLSTDHVAVVRNSQVITLFIQGAAVATSTTTSATSFSATSANPFFIGTDTTYRSLAGYITNFRIVAGTAVYTTAPFLPPLKPLDAVPGTTLLLNAASRSAPYADSSGNSVVVSPAGTLVWTPANPFLQLGSSGSLQFAGSATSVITVPMSAAALGTGPFTIEFFAFAQVQNSQRPFSIGAIAASPLLSLEFPTGGGGATIILPGGVNGVNTVGTFPVAYNTWQHWAIVRDVTGSTITVFCQGRIAVVAAISPTQSLSSTATQPFYIGTDTTFRAILGFISNFRIVVGSALYTAPFAPPTSPLTPVAGTTLLLSGSNSAAPIADSSGNNVVVTSVNVAWSPRGPFDTGACVAPQLITCTQVRAHVANVAAA